VHPTRRLRAYNIKFNNKHPPGSAQKRTDKGP
jgi:hypothetical protein